MNNPKVSIIFVNYKTAQMTADAINSVKEKTKDVTYEIIVVDNSCDETEFNKLTQCINDTNVKIIDAKGNLGFGKANNLGASYASGEYLFFLNTDTLLINDAISILAKHLDEHSEVGIVGGNLYNSDMTPSLSFNVKDKTLKNERKQNNILAVFKGKRNLSTDYFNYSAENLEVSTIIGADLMVRKEYFDKVGGFDKDIFMYAEEALLCFLVKKECKTKIYNVPRAKIIHLGGKSFNTKKYNVNQRKFNIDGEYIYYEKGFGEAEAYKYLKHKYRQFKVRYILSFFVYRYSHKGRKEILEYIKNKMKEVRTK